LINRSYFDWPNREEWSFATRKRNISGQFWYSVKLMFFVQNLQFILIRGELGKGRQKVFLLFVPRDMDYAHCVLIDVWIFPHTHQNMRRDGKRHFKLVQLSLASRTFQGCQAESLRFQSNCIPKLYKSTEGGPD